MLKEFFYFQKSDRKVMLFLLAVAVAAMLIIYGVGKMETTSVATADSCQTDNKRGTSVFSKRDAQYVGKTPERRPIELFYFDPNTADSTALLRLGLTVWQVRNIYKYRAAGGVYREPSDFAKLYGLSAGHYRQLQPYIRISDDFRPASEVYGNVSNRTHRDTTVVVDKIGTNERVALNASDTTAFKRVPGIGSYFASQIVNYRKRLGGYVAVSQLREIENFPESSLGYFVIDDVPLKKLNVNTATLNELKYHPYINFYQARAIVDYRRMKKSLSSLNELRLLKDFSPTDIERITPYVEF